MPWLPRPTLVDRLLRFGVCVAGAPLALAASLVSHVSAAVRGGDEPGNAFRVLARYDGTTDGERPST
jgi:hypothetical protein